MDELFLLLIGKPRCELLNLGKIFSLYYESNTCACRQLSHLKNFVHVRFSREYGKCAGT